MEVGFENVIFQNWGTIKVPLYKEQTNLVIDEAPLAFSIIITSPSQPAFAV
jgi:hypothetical protein